MDYQSVHVHNSSLKRPHLLFFLIPSIVFILAMYFVLTMLNKNRNIEISRVESADSAVLGEETELLVK
jgi:hypothetical protein